MFTSPYPNVSIPELIAQIDAIAGALASGATATTINARATADDIASQLSDARATHLITVTPLLDAALASSGRVGLAGENVIVIVLDGAEDYTSLADLIGAGLPAPEASFDPSVRLAVLPFFHIYGMLVLLNLALSTRATLVRMPRFDLVEFLHMIQGYGMSEMSPVSQAQDVARTDIPLGSVGFTIPNVECRLIDPLTDDGFLHTGDVATVSADGHVPIVDRLKELIKYKGYQVAPAELEALLLSHPLVADAAVIGVADADGEEVPKAYVVLQPQAELTEDEVIAFVADRVAPYKKVRQVEMIETIPKSSSGKILRKDLRILAGRS